MRELDFQKRIIDGGKSFGYFGMKLSHRFRVGVLDLLITTPASGNVMIEAKLCDEPTKNTTPVSSWMTALQIRTMEDIQHAGGAAGWIIGLRGKAGVTAYMGMDTIKSRPTPAFLDTKYNGVVFPYGKNNTSKNWGIFWETFDDCFQAQAR